MASTLARSARSLASRIAPRTTSRSFSAGHGAEEVEKWKKISIGMTGLVIVMSLKEFALGGDHGHHDDAPQPDYMRVRNKPFPWECSDCSPFDSPCFKKCKEERA